MDEPLRCSSRRSCRQNRPVQLSYSLQKLFHEDRSEEMQSTSPEDSCSHVPSKKRHRKNVELLRTNPNVYLHHDFLTEREFRYFDELCTLHDSRFRISHTDSDSSSTLYSEERTSSSLFLTKSQDAVVRSIEDKAGAFCSIPSHNIEPLQIVSYRDGQKFTVHHDSVCSINSHFFVLFSITVFILLFNHPRVRCQMMGCKWSTYFLNAL